MTKKKSDPVSYKVLTGIEHDIEGWRFEIGDVVTKTDIPKAPITHWLEKGVLEVVNGDG